MVRTVVGSKRGLPSQVKGVSFNLKHDAQTILAG